MRLWSWACAPVLALCFQVLLPEGMDKKRGAEEERYMGDTVGLSPGQNQPLSCAQGSEGCQGRRTS